MLTYCIMSNHFHLLLRVPGEDEIVPADEVSDAEVVRMVKALNGKEAATILKAELRDLEERGLAEQKEELRNRYLDRRGRLDVFVGQLKQRFSVWYNRKNDRHGTLWEERFRSVLVEGGDEALLTMAAYIDLNPVRAGMVADPADFAYSGFGEACAGKRIARRGLAHALEFSDPDKATWRRVKREYSMLLYGPTGAEQPITLTEDLASAILLELAGGGRVEPWQVLRLRNRYFCDGAVLGAKEFVENVFKANRDQFGPNRKSGARGRCEVSI